MLNLICLTILALHLWAVVVINNDEPIAEEVNYRLIKSFNHLRLYFILVYELITILFIDIFISLFKIKYKQTNNNISKSINKELSDVNITESDYPMQILNISSKLRNI